MRDATAGSAFVGLLVRDGTGLWRRRGELLSPLLFALMVAVLILIILAAVRANEGKPYRYPWIWRPIR